MHDRHHNDIARYTLVSNRYIVDIVEIAAGAFVEDGRAAEGEGVICANRPAARVDGAGLRWPVKLELVVRDNGTGAAEGVVQDAVF